MYRVLSWLVFAVLAFFGGMAAYDLRHADASSVGGGGSVSLATGSGGAVGVSGPIALTGPVSVTGTITATQGVGAVTGAFTGLVAITGPSGATGLVIAASGVNAYAAQMTGIGTGGALYLTSGTAGSGNYAITAIGGGTANHGGWFQSGTAQGYALVGNGLGTAEGVRAVNTADGYALSINGDTTSPARPTVYWSQQDAYPSSAVFIGGMMTRTGGSIHACTAAGTPGVFANVAFLGVRGVAAATGTTQATATALTTASDTWAVTGADGTKGVTLPTGSTGNCFSIHNRGAAALPVYGHNSDDDTINGGSADASVSMPAFTKAIFCLETNATAWTTY